MVPEAVLSDGQVELCARCGRGFTTAHAREGSRPQRMSIDDGGEGGSTFDDFEDMYCTSAPPQSIHAGADFGRLSALSGQGIDVDVSVLERLVLASK